MTWPGGRPLLKRRCHVQTCGEHLISNWISHQQEVASVTHFNSIKSIIGDKILILVSSWFWRDLKSWRTVRSSMVLSSLEHCPTA